MRLTPRSSSAGSADPRQGGARASLDAQRRTDREDRGNGGAMEVAAIGYQNLTTSKAVVGQSIAAAMRSKDADNERKVLPHLFSIALFLLIGEFRVWSGDLLFPALNHLGWYQQSAIFALRNAFAVHVALPSSSAFSMCSVSMPRSNQPVGCQPAVVLAKRR